MSSFWNNLPKPFTILAPMEGVTDTVFRQIILKLGRPDIFFTEFTSCDGIMSKGIEKVNQSLKFLENEKPIVAQIWGANLKNFYETAKYCKDLGFSGIDINMGCPIEAVVKRGACSGLIHNPKLAVEIIQATKDGGKLPVSIKTRLGFEEISTNNWIKLLLKQNLSALTIHLRTVLELSKASAHWEVMPEIIKLRNTISANTLIIGNGDIESYKEIEEKYTQFGCDGFMIGRGVLTNPWIFNKSFNLEDITTKERLSLYIKHINLFNETWKSTKNPESLKKFGKTYVNNFKDSANLRDEINLTKNTDEIIKLINKYINTL